MRNKLLFAAAAVLLAAAGLLQSRAHGNTCGSLPQTVTTAGPAQASTGSVPVTRLTAAESLSDDEVIMGLINGCSDLPVSAPGEPLP